MFHNPVPRQFPEYQLQNLENCHISPPDRLSYRTYSNHFDHQPGSKVAENPPEANPEPKPLTLEELRKIAKAEKRKKRRATLKYRTLHASRERIRVESFNKAFSELRGLLPTTPVDKKLSKIEILRVSIAYIRYLEDLLLLG